MKKDSIHSCIIRRVIFGLHLFNASIKAYFLGIQVCGLNLFYKPTAGVWYLVKTWTRLPQPQAAECLINTRAKIAYWHHLQPFYIFPATTYTQDTSFKIRYEYYKPSILNKRLKLISKAKARLKMAYEKISN